MQTESYENQVLTKPPMQAESVIRKLVMRNKRLEKLFLAKVICDKKRK